MTPHTELALNDAHDALDPGHAHPTWGACLCGHDSVEHLWTTGMRVDYQGECMHRPCGCETFHADPATIERGTR